jgi:hypothetical protein
VKEHDPQAIREELNNYLAARAQFRYTLNITCGTKIMALIAFEVFRDINARIVYLPPDKTGFNP